ncbi:hypothetical protein IEQ34_007457 [Dendrobium chrysotoxum]|uniref:Charged multivesicular body protein 5 n=1 Tax=Dendrobium chrysotoxum TaxID=161865 RepID=A0AAV7H5S2_DENCH|nr:hypothetical protein IEQ34_007457 [Dendrobium chrysotoxum]
MRRVFGAKKKQEPPPTIQDATDRINKRGDTVDEKINKLDSELARYKEQIKKTRPGPAQEALKARAMRVLKQRRIRIFNFTESLLLLQGFIFLAAVDLKGCPSTCEVEAIVSVIKPLGFR